MLSAVAFLSYPYQASKVKAADYLSNFLERCTFFVLLFSYFWFPVLLVKITGHYNTEAMSLLLGSGGLDKSLLPPKSKYSKEFQK